MDVSDMSKEEIDQAYTRVMKDIDAIIRDFQIEVDRGQDMEAMQKWNQLILDELGVDNISFFKLTE